MELLEDLVVHSKVNQTHKYNHQIAFIVCNHGCIDLLEVFDRSLEVVGPFEKTRRCGIGIVVKAMVVMKHTTITGSFAKRARKNLI